MHISFFRRYRFVAASALILSIVPAVVPQVSSDDQVAATDTRTYLQRLDRLGFSGVVLVARGDKPILAEGASCVMRSDQLELVSGTKRWSASTANEATLTAHGFGTSRSKDIFWACLGAASPSGSVSSLRDRKLSLRGTGEFGRRNWSGSMLVLTVILT